MTEPTPAPLPTARVDAPRRFRIPLVWVIPLVAALIGVFLAVHTWYQQGPSITIRFKTGEGLEAGKTRIKYKDVDVGQIDSVSLSEDGSYVIAGARLARSADPCWWTTPASGWSARGSPAAPCRASARC